MNRPMRHLWRLGIAAVLVPAGAAAVLLPLRGSIDNTNMALILTIPVLAIAITGRRWAVLLAAGSAAVAFDFLHTLPYYRLTMRHGADVVTAVLLLAVGLISGELAIRARSGAPNHGSTSATSPGSMPSPSLSRAGNQPSSW
jgi:K+-sensing histidine kinase KdpD